MKKGRLKQILIQLKELIKDPTYTGGMCEMLHIMYMNGNITSDEEIVLIKYLIKHRPLNSYFWFLKTLELYWWNPNKKEPRIKWLNKQIKKIKVN